MTVSAIMGFEGICPDEFKEWYFDRQTRLVERIDSEDDKKFLEQAFSFYVDFVIKKRGLDKKIKQH